MVVWIEISRFFKDFEIFKDFRDFQDFKNNLFQHLKSRVIEKKSLTINIICMELFKVN